MYALSFFGDMFIMLNMFAVIQYFSKIVSMLLQARRQEMKWGWVFFVKVENGFFCKKKWTFPQRRVHYVQNQYFLFYILLI